jgi:galactokinase
MNGRAWISVLKSEKAKKVFMSLYGEIEKQRARYIKLVEDFFNKDMFPGADLPETNGDLRFFTAAGRTELGGNHTDHNHGKVLAASIRLDNVAIVRQRSDNTVFFLSKHHLTL